MKEIGWEFKKELLINNVRENPQQLNVLLNKFLDDAFDSKTGAKSELIDGVIKEVFKIFSTSVNKQTTSQPVSNLKPVPQPTTKELKDNPSVKEEEVSGGVKTQVEQPEPQSTKLNFQEKHDVEWKVKVGLPGKPKVCDVPNQYGQLKPGGNSACTVIDMMLVKRCTGKNFNSPEMKKEYIKDLKLGCKVYSEELNVNVSLEESKHKNKHISFDDLTEQGNNSFYNNIKNKLKLGGDNFNIEQKLITKNEGWNQPLNYMQQVVENKRQAMTFGITRPPHSFTIHINYNETSEKSGEVYLLDSHDDKIYEFGSMADLKQFISQDKNRETNKFLPGQFMDCGVGFDNLLAQQYNMVSICHKN